MGETARPALAEFVHYLPRVQELNLTQDQVQAIPVHAEPASDQVFIGLGELPPGAPRIEEGPYPFVGTRQIYVYESDTPRHLWQRLVVALGPHRASGSGGTGMFGNADERAVDEDDPAHSWRVLNAGEPFRPPEL